MIEETLGIGEMILATVSKAVTIITGDAIGIGDAIIKNIGDANMGIEQIGIGESIQVTVVKAPHAVTSILPSIGMDLLLPIGIFGGIMLLCLMAWKLG